MRKIFDQQLSLAEHPAAQSVLPQPVDAAQALVKGWLFYHRGDALAGTSIGVDGGHCRGFWCEMSQADQLSIRHGAILSRLAWLAPARLAEDVLLDGATLLDRLAQHFSVERTPVLVAIMERAGDTAIEIERGFIVPNDWADRARSLHPGTC